jgi:DNA helicase II / ATP-dependent DNA helicase PcrA
MLNTSSKFTSIYKNLNDKQKEAVDHIEGPVMVVAGPGTGKTQILTARIANILLKTQVNPENILALTFTESGAFEMKKRLIEMIGETAYYVSISTFHSFCSEIIKANPEEFLISQNLEPLSDLERIQIFREILEENDFEVIKPFNARYYYVPAIIKNIQNLKREGIDPKELIKKVKHVELTKEFEEKDQTKCLELAKIYEVYQKKLVEQSRYDFEDMINLVVSKFKENKEFLQIFQERFQYVLVDEFQDTNSAQSQVIFQLAAFWGEEANLFVVGDDEQSIYRFQGASLENFYVFHKNFPKALVVTLDKNYRSTQLILDASREVINKNEQSIEKVIKGITKNLKSVKHDRHSEPELGEGEESSQVSFTIKEDPSPPKADQDDEHEKIEVRSFRNNLFENYSVADKIRELIKDGVSPSEIAILYRNNSDSKDLAEILRKQGIDFAIEGGNDILKSPEIKKLIYLFKVILDVKTKKEDVDLFTLLNFEFLNFESLDVLRLSRYASENKINLFEAIQKLIETPDKEKPKFENWNKIESFYNQLLDWSKKSENLTFVSLFELIISESGFLKFILDQKDNIESLNNLNSFFSEIKKLNNSSHDLSLETFFQNLKILEEHGIGMTGESDIIERNCVKLMTAHKAKGKEFEHVFLIKFVDKKWGNNKERELIKLPENILETVKLLKKEKNEDERRLFYVALTRAKKKLYLSSSEEYQLAESDKKCNPSMFFSELPSPLTTCIHTSEQENKYVKQYFSDFKSFTLPTTHDNLAAKDFLLDIIKDFKLNVTALNVYLQCPYKFKLNTLLKTPRAKDKSLSLGTAVHRSLELFFKHIKDKRQVPGEDFLHIEFENALKGEILSRTDYIDTHKKGKKILSAYFAFYKDQFKRPLFTEKFFGYGFAKIFLDDIPLVGKVDKIEIVDEEKKQVKVVDYKTGKHRSRNDIEGVTATSDGGYKRQLVFYKLLADLDHSFNLRVVETELDFVEPDEKGSPKKEVFVISDDEVKALKEVIRQVMKDIRDLKFERTTDFKICARCEYRDHCWPEGIPTKYNIEEKQLDMFQDE